MANIYEDAARDFIMSLVDEYRFDSIDEVGEYLDNIANREDLDYFTYDSLETIKTRVKANEEYVYDAYVLRGPGGMQYRDIFSDFVCENWRKLDYWARKAALDDMFWDLSNWISITIKRQKGA